MDIENDTPIPTEIRREHIAGAWGHVIATSKVTFEVEADHLVLSRAQEPVHREPCAAAPAGEIRPTGDPGVVDILCTGDIHAPGDTPATSVDVRLEWADEVRIIRGFGKRHWQRTEAGDLAPSPPEPFLKLPMEWGSAYGGKHRVPAGFAPGTRLPMPSGEVAWPPNPAGIGFYVSAEQAEGRPLPLLEDPSSLIRSWSDRPLPVCFAPCPMESALRWPDVAQDGGEIKLADGVERAPLLRMLRTAQPKLRTRKVETGTVFQLTGMSRDKEVRFTIPQLNFAWTVTAGSWTRMFEPQLSTVHIRAAERRVSLLLRTDLVYPLVREQRRAARFHATGAVPLPRMAVPIGGDPS